MAGNSALIRQHNSGRKHKEAVLVKLVAAREAHAKAEKNAQKAKRAIREIEAAAATQMRNDYINGDMNSHFANPRGRSDWSVYGKQVRPRVNRFAGQTIHHSGAVIIDCSKCENKIGAGVACEMWDPMRTEWLPGQIVSAKRTSTNVLYDVDISKSAEIKSFNAVPSARLRLVVWPPLRGRSQLQTLGMDERAKIEEGQGYTTAQRRCGIRVVRSSTTSSADGASCRPFKRSRKTADIIAFGKWEAVEAEKCRALSNACPAPQQKSIARALVEDSEAPRHGHGGVGVPVPSSKVLVRFKKKRKKKRKSREMER